MNKSQLIDTLAARFEGNRKQAAHALESVLDTITREVAKGEKVAITGFGSFEKRVRDARWVRNPRTGERIKAKKTAIPKFSAGADLKAVVSGAKKLPKLTVAAATRREGRHRHRQEGGPGHQAAAKKAPATKTAAKKAPATKARPRRPRPRRPAKTGHGQEGSRHQDGGQEAPATKAAPAKKTATKTVAKKAPATKAPAKKTATKTVAKKAPATKTAPAKKTATKTATKTAAKKAPAKKTTAKKAPAKKTAAKKA